MSDLTGKKAPVGTQRYWESTGQIWIKTHDNTIFDNNIAPWIPVLTVPAYFQELFFSLDQKGRKVVGYKDPIDGDLWLSKEFENFTTTSGKKFSAADFKQYSPFDKSAAKYSFRSELTKRLEQDRIDLNARIAEALVQLNDRRKTEKLRNGEDVGSKITVLTDEEIKATKSYVRESFKGSDNKLTIEDVKEIDTVLSKVLAYLEKGENFEGDQLTVYQTCIQTLEQVKSGPYVSINTTRDNISKAYSLMSTHFSDNWGIRESYRKKMENAFSDFIRKYKSQIEAEEVESFKQKLGVSLYSDTETFYNAIKKSDFFKDINLNDYIGKMIPSPYDKYKSVKLTKIKASDDDTRVYFQEQGSDKEDYTTLGTAALANLIRQREFNLPDIDIPFKLRLSEKFKKDLKGTFDINDLTLLETFERVNDYLPPGHSINNNLLRAIRKEDSFTSDNSYAHYAPSKSEIFLSSKCISKSDIGIVDIHSGKEIASTLIHEIGHAVSNKLGRRDSKEYRKFVVECGWSWEQFQIGDRDSNYIATGNDPDLKRYGSKSDRKLITEYAGKSPEEAFAEYYSVYSQYKTRIDKYLETGDIGHLEKDRELKVDLSKTHFREHLKNADDETRENRQNAYALLLESKRDLNDHIRVDAIDPYNTRLETHIEKDVLSGHIAYNKRKGVANRKEPQPVFTIFDYHTGKYDLIKDKTDAGIHYSNKYLRRDSPVFAISKECYNILQKAGFSYEHIRDFTLSQVADKKIPNVLKAHTKENTITGLNYRGKVIPSQTLHSGVEIFKQMKHIWESEELQKALQDLFNNENENNMIKANEFNDLKFKDTLSDALKTFTDTISNVLSRPSKGGRKYYADSILRNEKGEILLLQRSTQDDFMPGKWWLPGGKIEIGEDPIIAAERELFEETGIDMKFNLSFLEKREKKECTIYYFEGLINSNLPIILDSEEHYRIQWTSLDKLDTLDLLEDKEALISLPTNLLQEIQEDQIGKVSSYDMLFRKRDVIDCLFNTNIIPLEEYLGISKTLKTETFNLIEQDFDKGNISEKDYLFARKLVK